jgi:hypothetical protein
MRVTTAPHFSTASLSEVGGGDARPRRLRFLSCLAFFIPLSAFVLPVPAFAHASERGHTLLLPTGYYAVGGAFAVAASFLVLALLPGDFLDRFWRKRLPLFAVRDDARTVVSLLSFACLAVLVAAGFWGSRDPLSNPLPLTVWTLLWVGITLVQGLAGDVWAWLNPWYGPWRLVSRLTGREGWRLPSWIGYWPAFFLFAAFAWFELVDPAPDDPGRLATAVGLYWLVSFVAMLAFGHAEWSRRGEFLSVFFSMVSRFAVVERDTRGRVKLCWPGAKLLDADPLPLSGGAFILLALSSVSFDGLSKTFFWLGRTGINPLEFPGRTAVLDVSTAGLALTFLMLAVAFMLAAFLGERIAGSAHALRAAAGLLVWSIVPIALAYHFAHNLTSLLVDGQYAAVALSDPFALGWNLFGTADMQVEAGIVAGAGQARLLWNLQAAAIIVGHVNAVLVAHGLAWRLHPIAARAALSQIPLTLLMIVYTVFGLWLLATPSI